MILRGKEIETHSLFPDTNFYSDDPTITDVVPDNSELSKKIIALRPNFDKVYDDGGKLVDVIAYLDITYTKDLENPLTPGQLLTITSEVAPVTLIDEEEISHEVQDGIIQYSNTEPGTYILTLQAEGYKPTEIEVIVSGN